MIAVLGRKSVRAEYPPDRIGGIVDAVGRNAVERRQPDGGVMLWNAGSPRHGPALCIYLKPIISAQASYWKGDLLAFACLIRGKSRLFAPQQSEKFCPRTTDSFSG
jgi:hypothetical protein